MADSAGNAENEMSIIMESLDYKINALKETATGIFQNIFQTEEMGNLIGLLTGLLNVLDGITSTFGLLGTAMIAVPIVAFIKNFGKLKLLGIAGTTSISATAAAVKGLSTEETIAALATTNLNKDEMAAALVKAGYTNATASQTAALALEAREEEAAAAETLKKAGADTVATGTTTGLSVATTGLTNVLKGLWATLKANPFILVLAGLAALIAAVDAYQKRVERAAEALSDSSEEVKSLQSEMDDLNSELKTTQDRIEELLRKPSLTIVEQNELKNLQITNNELERQIELKERALKVSQGKNADNFVNAVNSKKTENGGDGWWFGYRNYGDFKTSPYKDKDHPNRPEANTTGKSEEQYYMFQVRLEDYQEAEAKYQKALQDGNEQEAKQWEERKTELNTAMSGYVSDMTGYLTDLGEYDYSTLSDEAKAAVDYIYDIQNAYLMATGNSGESVFSDIYNQGRFAEGKEAIEKLKESGKLTAQTFQDLYNSNDSVKAMIDNMQQVGLINDTTAGTFDNLTNQILGTKSAAEEAAQIQTMPFSEFISGEGVQDTIDSFKTKLTTLSDALEDFHNGDLSDSDLIDLFKEFPELANRTDDLDTALNELIDSTQTEIDNQFDSWQKSMPTDEDADSLNAVKSSLIGIAEQATGLNKVTAEIEKLNSALDDLKSTYDDIQSVIDDYNDNGYLTLDNLQSIMDLEPEYINLLIDENGQINLNNQAYKDYVISKAKSLLVNQLSSLYESILAMTAEEAQAYANAKAFDEETRSVNDLLTATTKLYVAQAQAKDSANGNTNYMDALTKSFGTAANYAAIVENYINSLGTSQNEFTKETNGATSALEAQKEALESEKSALEDYKDSLEDAKDALEDYKDSLEDAQDDIQSLIDLTIDYIKQMKENEKDAINEQIDALDKQKDALDDQKDAYSDLISKKKEEIELLYEEKKAQDELSEKQKSAAKDALALAIAQLDDSSAGKKSQKQAADNYAESSKDLKDYLDEQEKDKRIAALEEEETAYEEMIEKRKAAIDEQVEHLESKIDEIDNYLDNSRKLYEDACNMIDNDNGTLYSNLWNYTYTYTTKTRAEFDYLWSSAQAAIQRYKGDNDTLIGTMEFLQGKIYDTDRQINDLNTQIDNCETQIGYLDDAISSTSDAISATSDSIDSVSGSIDGLGNSISDYINKLNQLTGINIDGTDNSDTTPKYLGHGYDASSGNYYYKVKFRGRDYYGYVGDSSDTTAVRERAYNAIMKEVYKYNSFNDVNPLLFKNAIVNHHAKGTRHSAGGISVTQEEGLEAIFGKLSQGQYTMMPQGSQVFNAGMTDNLWKFSSDPQKFISDVIGKMSSFLSSSYGNFADSARGVTNKVTKYGGDVTLSSAPVYHIYGNVDKNTLSTMDKQERQRYELFKKQFMLEMLREKNNL